METTKVQQMPAPSSSSNASMSNASTTKATTNTVKTDVPANSAATIIAPTNNASKNIAAANDALKTNTSANNALKIDASPSSASTSNTATNNASKIASMNNALRNALKINAPANNAMKNNASKNNASKHNASKNNVTPRAEAGARKAGAGQDPQDQEQPEVKPSNRVVVSGYPPYTQPQDLIHAFAKIGAVNVDKCNCRVAVLAFPTDKEARAAADCSKRLAIYGQLLTVRPYTSKLVSEEMKHVPKKEFTRSKQKGMIIEPKQLDLSGDFYSQLDTIMAAVRLTQEDVAALSALYTDLENALQVQWPGCTAIPFGSITTGLGVKSSDADCFINVPPQFRHAGANFVNKAKRLVQQYPDTFAEIISIPRANTPIVKFFHIPTETNCDVTFKTPLGVQNSKLVAFLLHADPRLIPVAVAVKYWAKVHDLSGTGKLTNYALTLLIIFYLQQPPLAILPSVAWLQRGGGDAWLVDRWDTGFRGQRARLPPADCAASISDLLGGFFEYYSMFNFEEMVVCPYLGVPLKKDAFKDPDLLPEEFERYKSNVRNNFVLPLRYTTSICVQDPFEQCHNVASPITTKLASDLKAYFKFAANAYEKEKLNKCAEFLRIILLQRPKIVRAKSNPEYRVNLFPRIVSPIIDPDWKSVVRMVAMTIFENMLKIKLGKIEEKVSPDSRKEKEKYIGNVTKAIWKRKQFSKLYVVMNLNFEEKQAKITEEIMSADKQIIGLQFQLTLTYCQDPKSAVIAVRLGGGDLDAFREFGKFFISVMQNWYIQLLKPYSRPNTKDTATKIAETIDVLDNINDIETDDEEEPCAAAGPHDNAHSELVHHSLNNNAPPASGSATGDVCTQPECR